MSRKNVFFLVADKRKKEGAAPKGGPQARMGRLI